MPGGGHFTHGLVIQLQHGPIVICLVLRIERREIGARDPFQIGNHDANDASGTEHPMALREESAGMLAPGMATMLCVLTTDAVVDAAALDSALRGATRTTFDRVDSDGCMSTNDSGTPRTSV